VAGGGGAVGAGIINKDAIMFDVHPAAADGGRGGGGGGGGGYV